MKPDRVVSRPDAAGTDRDAEERVFKAMQRERVSRRRIAAVMGITPGDVDQIRRRIERHEARDPLRRERGVAGTQLYKLNSFWFPQLEQGLTGTSVSGWTLGIVENDLLSSLNEAKMKLARLEIEGRAARSRVDETETRLSQLRTDTAHDAEMALIEDRPADSKLPKAASAAEAELKTAQQSAKAHAGAVKKQAAIVGKIEDQIAANQYEIFSKAIAEPQKRLDKAVIELMTAAVDVADLASLHGFEQSHILVTRGDLNDDVLSRLVGVVRTGLQAAYFWENAFVNAPKFHKANHQGPFIITQRAIPIDPVAQRINDERARLSSLTEQFCILSGEQWRAEREADGLRYQRRNIEGGYFPLAANDKPEYDRLMSIVGAKTLELKSNEAERQKCIEGISKLEKELQQKTADAIAAA